MPGMQTLPLPGRSRHERVAIATTLLSATLLVGLGAWIGLVVLTTPLLASLVPAGRRDGIGMAVGAVAWALAIVVPAGFVIAGLARVVRLHDRSRAVRRGPWTPRLAAGLGHDHLAVADLRLPGGRRIHELVLGPFGIVVLGDVPPASASRRVGSMWELRDRSGRWHPVESPVDRATRNAERVRAWTLEEDRDFTVKVWAAIVTTDPRVTRTGSCAVLAPHELEPWLAGLPPQRGLTEDRRDHLVGIVRRLSAASGR